MQDTPEFPQLSARFSTYNKNELLNNAPAITAADHVYTIDRIFETLTQYFTQNDFRGTLTLQRKRNIESQIANVFNQLDQINSLRSNGSLPGSLDGIMNSLQAYLDEIDIRFTQPYEMFVQSGRINTSQMVTSLQEDVTQAGRTVGELQNKLTEANLLIGTGANIKMADFFQRLANGMTVKEHENHLKNPHMSLITLMKWYGGGALVVAILLLLGADELVKFFNHQLKAVDYIRLSGLSLLLLLPAAAVTHNWLNKSRPGGHERAAVIWATGAVASVAATGIYAAVLLLELGENPGWDAIVPKLVSLLAPAFLVRFCVKNYRVNKHLAVQNTHRAATLQVLESYTSRLARTEDNLLVESLKQQAAIYLAIASLLFDPGETGFITRGEGAGSEDNFFDGIPKPGS